MGEFWSLCDYHTKHYVEYFHHSASLSCSCSLLPLFSLILSTQMSFPVPGLLECKRNRCCKFPCGCLLLLNVCFEIHHIVACLCGFSFFVCVMFHCVEWSHNLFTCSPIDGYWHWTLLSKCLCSHVFSFLLGQILRSGIAGS